MVRFMKGIALANRWLYDNKEPAIDFLTHEMQLKPHHGAPWVGVLHSEIATGIRTEIS
jgi:hypothetical protein